MKHFLKKSLIFTSMSLLLFSCTSPNSSGSGDDPSGPIDPPDPEIVAVSEIKVENHLSIEEDSSIVLGVQVLPDNASDKNLNFTSSNPQVASIDSSYTIYGVSEGVTTISFSSVSNPEITASTTVTVTKKSEAVVHVQSISLGAYDLSLEEGSTYDFSYAIYPDNATNKTVFFSSSKESVATVDNTGHLVAISAGTTKIEVKTQDSAKVAYCNVTVTSKPDPEPGPGPEPGPEPEPMPAIDHVQVFCLKGAYTHLYAWQGQNNEILGGWPGSKITTTYEDSWLTYEFNDYQSLNFIFSNNGQGQTRDLSAPHAGYYWYVEDQLLTTKPQMDEQGHVIVPEPTEALGHYEVVTKAKSYADLPAVKNYNKGRVLYPYTGSRDDFRDESIYFAITTRFYDGDKTNNVECWDGRNNDANDPSWRGDFKGLIEKMDYIKALGFTAIWITPVVKNCSGYDYHGYHAINFKEVDPRYLSQDVDFSTVIQEAHKRDMKIVLDVVFNHTGNWGEENLFPIFTYDPGKDATINGVKMNKEFGLIDDSYWSESNKFQARIRLLKTQNDAFNIYHHEMNMGYESYIEQTGSLAGDCIDLNTENPIVANYLVDAFGEFIRMGVDAFRIDTMKHISRLTFNKYIWPGLYAIAEKCGNNHFYMFGEDCTRVRGVWNHNVQADSCPFYTWNESEDYAWGTRVENEQSTKKHWDDHVSPDGAPTSNNVYLNGVNYHAPDYSRSSHVSTIDFPMHWNFQYARDAYGVAVGNDKYYNDASYNVVYVDSHDYGPDGIESVRYNMGEDAWKENMSLMFTFRGIPCIYYGSEIEFQKGCTIDEGPNLALSKSGRAYYGDHLEGNVTATDFGVYSASGEVKTTLNSTLSKHLQKLNKIRLKVPALRRGQYTTGNVSNANMAFTRRYTVGNVDSLACVAISGGATFYSLPNGTYVDLVSGTIVNVNNGTLTANVSGQGSLAVFVLENSSTGLLTAIN